MANLKVSIVIRIKLPSGSRAYCRPVFTAAGKLKPLYAEVNGHPEHHPEGVYAIRYRHHGRFVYESIGCDPAEILISQKKREAALNATAVGLALAPERSPKSHDAISPVAPKRLLSTAIADYLAETKAHKSSATFRHLFSCPEPVCEVLQETLPGRHRSKGHSGIYG